MLPTLSESRISLADRSIPYARPTAIVLGGAALAAICAHVALPLWFTPVPLTLQPFAVLLLGLILEPQLAAITFLTYLAEGAMGLPVFAPAAAPAGIAHLMGPTGGYLLAYPLAAALISWIWRRSGRGFAAALFAAAAGDLAILACGACWLAALAPSIARPAGELAILPFLPGDALKVAVAAGLACGWMRLRRQPAELRHK